MNCRELGPEEVVSAGDQFQVKHGGDRLFAARYSVSMTVADALAKWPHIEAFYRPVTAPAEESRCLPTPAS